MQGDVVLVHDDCLRISWKLAVVQELLKGKDGLVNIRMANGKTNCPIARLIPLEVSSNSVSNNSTSAKGVSTQSAIDCDSSSDITRLNTGCPKRQAAEYGRDRIKAWIKELSPSPPPKMSWTDRVTQYS